MDHYEFFGGSRCGYTLFPLNLSLIGPLTTEIYYQTGIAVTHRHTHIETDTLRSSKKGGKDKSNYLLGSFAFSLSVSFSVSTCQSCSILSFFTIYFFLLLPFCFFSLSHTFSLSHVRSLYHSPFLSPLYEKRIKCVS